MQIQHCDPTWPDSSDTFKCLSYSLLTQHNNTLYKNPHCARCNHVNTSQVNCFPAINCMRFLRSFTLPEAFSTLVDFSSNDCSKEEFYDPLKKVCYYMQCYNNNNNNISVGKCNIQDCPRKTLNAGEFYFGDIGTLIENLTGISYPEGEYELNNTIAYVCDGKLVYLSTITSPQKKVTFVVLILSLLCLLAHITIYILLPKFQNLPGRNLFSLSCSLFTAYLLFLVGAQVAGSQGMCMLVGLSLHYFWLASFCWMNVMSLDVFITFKGHVHRRPDSGGKTYLKYSIYAWGVPFIVVISALITQFTDILPAFKPNYAGRMCWINNRDALVLYFILPIGVIVLENVALFISTSYGIYQQTKLSKFAMRRSQSVKTDTESAAQRKKNEKNSKLSRQVNVQFYMVLKSKRYKLRH